MKDLFDGVSKSIEEKIMILLENEFAGSKAFRVNNFGAKYFSNCNGTMEYIYSLRDINHPRFLSSEYLENYIKESFELSDKFLPGELVVFYKTPSVSKSFQIKNQENIILHSLIMLRDNKIFNQSGSGGIFEIKNFEDVKKKLCGFFWK